MRVGSQKWLRALRDETNTVLARLKGSSNRSKRFNCDGVNWADLSCTEVYWCRNAQGQGWAAVVISEVAPGAMKLPTAVRDGLAVAGFFDVEIRTEW